MTGESFFDLERDRSAITVCLILQAPYAKHAAPRDQELLGTALRGTKELLARSAGPELPAAARGTSFGLSTENGSTATRALLY